MDIPSTGAIFTLGRSLLAENTQSYFYIKNDPIKRLACGPHQSAVICESGRLFVWGENHHGQLGIGGTGGGGGGGGAGNNNNNNNNGTGTGGDTVTKPTCVKALKTLGLKIAEVAYGSDWVVILTQSNELFYSGRSVFPPDAPVARNFTEATIDGERCAIIRKPFRLEEFDECLSRNEEAEHFLAVLAGNKHFAVLTSFGRLLGWGSNRNHQLGGSKKQPWVSPQEIELDAPVQQFACGPESTLVLTSAGNLYLTGRLNEFVFTQFTELQKNLSASEQIIYMHISKASEIFIITSASSIYRSMESVRNKSLIFQRFYDYDSEEHGPIWKLIKGLSFFAVLTQAYKFYTTFSESGHHLKTFREISKFKNLRLLDMSVGEQHVLVHGIPRTAALSATARGPGSGLHRFASPAFAVSGGTSAGRHRSSHSRSGQRGTGETAAEHHHKEAKKKGMESINSDTIIGTSKVVMAAAHMNGLDASKDNQQEHQAIVEVHEHNSHEDVKEEQQDEALTTTTIDQNGNGTEEQEAVQEEEPVQDEEAAPEEEDPTADSEEHKSEQVADKPTTPPAVEEQKVEKIAVLMIEPTAPSHGEVFATNEREATPDKETQKEETPAVITTTTTVNHHADEDSNNNNNNKDDDSNKDDDDDFNGNRSETSMALTVIPSKSPADSLKSRRSVRSVRLDQARVGSGQSMTSSVNRLLRPRTPYPESSSNGGNTPQTVKKTPLRNYSYEAAMEQDFIDRTSPELADSLDNIPEGVAGEEELAEVKAIKSAHHAALAPPEDEDEELAVEISETVDALDHTMIVNEIRFINNGVDVTANVKAANKSTDETEGESNETSLAEDSSVAEVREEAVAVLDKLERDIEEGVEKAVEKKRDLGQQMRDTTDKVGSSIETKFHEASESVQMVARNAAAGARGAAAGARDAVDTVGENAKRMAVDAKHAVEHAGSNARDAVDAAGENAKRMASDARHAVETAGSNAKHAVETAGSNARHAVETAGGNAMRAAGGAGKAVGTAMGNVLYKMADGTKYAVDSVVSKISNDTPPTRENMSSMMTSQRLQKETAAAAATAADDDDVSSKEGGPKTNTTTGEDDERTTASVNSTHTSTGGNPFDNGSGESSRGGGGGGGNPFENAARNFDNELDDAVTRGKKVLREEVHTIEHRTEEELEHGKGKVRQFFSDIRAKGRGLSCRNEKAIRIEDDPPRYTVEDTTHTGQFKEQGNEVVVANQNSSKVCSIL